MKQKRAGKGQNKEERNTNLLEETARHLAFLGFGEAADRETDGNIFYGRLPEREGLTIAVLSSDAGAPGRTARLQILTRAPGDREAFESCQQIAQAMDGYEGYLMGWGRRASIRLEHGAHGLGADEKRRAIYACDVKLSYC